MENPPLRAKVIDSEPAARCGALYWVCSDEMRAADAEPLRHRAVDKLASGAVERERSTSSVTACAAGRRRASSSRPLIRPSLHAADLDVFHDPDHALPGKSGYGVCAEVDRRWRDDTHRQVGAAENARSSTGIPAGVRLGLIEIRRIDRQERSAHQAEGCRDKAICAIADVFGQARAEAETRPHFASAVGAQFGEVEKVHDFPRSLRGPIASDHHARKFTLSVR